MSEMIERVARAIVEAEFGKGAPVANGDRYIARAAIEAMRDRNEAMLDAGTAVLWPFAWRLAPGSTAVKVWEAMVDAALNASSSD